jgi:hypothetical protein
MLTIELIAQDKARRVVAFSTAFMIYLRCIFCCSILPVPNSFPISCAKQKVVRK